MSKILLSICIPTNGRIEILKNTLDSIFSRANDFSEFEVVLSDNSKTDELPELLKQYSSIPNIVYHKTEVSGFMNSVNALKMGKGELLKLHNNYTELKKGSLSVMIETARKYQTTKPVLFFSSSTLKHIAIEKYHSFNEFIYSLSYFSSWSSGFSIWNSDFQQCCDVEYNKMFPHTSLLFELSKKELYIINNEELFYNQDVSKKGGYNLFRTFCVDYLNLLTDCFNRKNITLKTLNHVKKHMFYNFAIYWYYTTKVKRNDFTFDLTEIKKSMSMHYSSCYYYVMILCAWSVYPLKNVLNFVYSCFKSINVLK
jgi:abequosyltransferase